MLGSAGLNIPLCRKRFYWTSCCIDVHVDSDPQIKETEDILLFCQCLN